MKTHVLKASTDSFVEFLAGNKTYDIRFNDRDYQKGDIIVLVEYNGIFTGKEIRYEVVHVQSGWGLQDNYVALSLRPLISKDVQFKESSAGENRPASLQR